MGLQKCTNECLSCHSSFLKSASGACTCCDRRCGLCTVKIHNTSLWRRGSVFWAEVESRLQGTRETMEGELPTQAIGRLLLQPSHFLSALLPLVLLVDHLLLELLHCLLELCEFASKEIVLLILGGPVHSSRLKLLPHFLQVGG